MLIAIEILQNDLLSSLLFGLSMVSIAHGCIASGNAPPSKPWERAGTSSGPVPFRPQSSGRTSEVVEASGTAKPGEVVTGSERNATVNRNTLGRPLPPRPWQQNYGTSHGGNCLFICVLAHNCFDVI